MLANQIVKLKRKILVKIIIIKRLQKLRALTEKRNAFVKKTKGFKNIFLLKQTNKG